MNTATDQDANARKLIYALLVTLVFEGVIRKLVPSGLSIGIFFLKDVLCLISLYFIINIKLPETAQMTAKVFKIVIILMYPLLLYNLFIDPILIVWGGKLYLLYFVVAIMMTIAFPPNLEKQFLSFSKFINILIVLAVSTGFLQLNLPATHWINRGVKGESLERFAAAGQLRISSTFSFTGQYSFFLVFATALSFCFFFFYSKSKKATGFYLVTQIAMVLLLLVGGFNTGGRSAVLGIFSIIGLGLFLVGLNNPFFAFKRLILPVLLFIFVFPIIQQWKPEYFAAYTERSSGTKNDDVYTRVLEPFYELTNSSILGNGLGVMTNGSDKVSGYAALIRSTGLWTETDFKTIIWEGGYYLILVWYGFRLFVIFYSFRILRSIKDNNYYSAASFVFAYVLVNGLIGTLTIQPPLAIYFWICFGALICIQKFDEYNQNYLNQNA